MKIDGNTIIFTSEEPYFIKERLGHKPNTVRFVDSYPDILDLEYIRIEGKHINEQFTRTLTDISRVGQLLGKELFVFSWDPNEVVA